jgi:hypothetical protein
MESRGSRLSSQETASGLYPEPYESNPQSPLYIFMAFVIIILKSCKWYAIIQVISFWGKYLARYIPNFYLRLKAPFSTWCVLSEYRKTDKAHTQTQ